MPFVQIERNEQNVPSDNDIETAMSEAKGTVQKIEGTVRLKTVTYTGNVNHTNFENALIRVAKGRRNSWNFIWGDALDAGAAGAPGELLTVPRQANGTYTAVNGQVLATQYEVDIMMSAETVTQLLEENYNLYGFKAVQSTGGGAPLVWFGIADEYSTLTQIVWSVQYQAYTSRSKIIPNGQVTASFSTDINLGQTLYVEAGGIGDVKSGGPPQAISIQNTTDTQFTCGISQPAPDGSVNPMCAFTLHGLNLDVIAPIEKVLLMFSTKPVNTGTVIEQAYSPGILIDLTSANKRTVSFEINKGWSWGGYGWAQSVPANAELKPLLIEADQAISGGMVEARSLVRG